MDFGRFREKVNKRLRNNSGESLAETLVALLISALALAMLAGIIAAGVKIINNEKDKLERYYNKNEAIVNLTADSDSTTITFDFDKGTDPNVPVDLYTNDEFKDKPVISYKAQ